MDYSVQTTSLDTGRGSVLVQDWLAILHVLQ